MPHEYSCGAVVFTRKDDQLLYVIIRQRDGSYGFPKGHMEEGETVEQTAVREIREEVGLRVRLLEGFSEQISYTLPQRRRVLKHVTYLLADYEDQKITIQHKELRSATLLPFKEALEKLQHENTRAVLRKANTFLLEREPQGPETADLTNNEQGENPLVDS